MNPAFILILAFILDAILGEPRWLWSRFPHPIVLMGRCVGFLDQKLNNGTALRIKGIAAMVLLGLGAVYLGIALGYLPDLVQAFIVAIVLAHRSLVVHVRAVALALRQTLPEARRAVSHIVGRDVRQMSSADVSRAAIESAAENFSDGVIAPAFWFLVAGLPGLLLYKVANTADSMIGYRTPRHAAFGWAAARLDDVLNVVPARLAAALIMLSYGLSGQRAEIAREARLHRSPNAGWPEAAMAQALGVALAGPRSYEGTLQIFPFVNETGKRDIGAPDVERACGALWRTWCVSLALTALIAVVLSGVHA